MKKIVSLIVAVGFMSVAVLGFAKEPKKAPVAAAAKTEKEAVKKDEEAIKKDKEVVKKDEEAKPKKSKKESSHSRYYSKWIHVENAYESYKYRWCRDNSYPYDFYKCDFRITWVNKYDYFSSRERNHEYDPYYNNPNYWR